MHVKLNDLLKGTDAQTRRRAGERLQSVCSSILAPHGLMGELPDSHLDSSNPTASSEANQGRTGTSKTQCFGDSRDSKNDSILGARREMQRRRRHAPSCMGATDGQRNWPNMRKTLGKPGSLSGEDRNRTFECFPCVSEEFERYQFPSTLPLKTTRNRFPLASVYSVCSVVPTFPASVYSVCSVVPTLPASVCSVCSVVP